MVLTCQSLRGYSQRYGDLEPNQQFGGGARPRPDIDDKFRIGGLHQQARLKGSYLGAQARLLPHETLIICAVPIFGRRLRNFVTFA
jgi:hypothetical protein